MVEVFYESAVSSRTVLLPHQSWQSPWISTTAIIICVIIFQITMSEEEGREMLGSLITIVSELLGALAKSDQRNNENVLEAREVGRCKRGSFSLFKLDMTCRGQAVACRDLSQS